jgi:hypothetical protein
MVQLKRDEDPNMEGENNMKIKNVIDKPEETKTEASATLTPEITDNKTETTNAASRTASKAAAPEKVNTVKLPDGTEAVKAPAQKAAKELSPRAWERIDETEDGKKRLVSQITWLRKQVDYKGDMIEEYKWPNLDAKDGKKRTVTARFPKADKPDSTDEITYMGYTIGINKYGNSAVCSLSDAEGLILQYVSLATVIDVLQDLLNPNDTCNITWGSIDQAIKNKRGLKSRIKNLGSDDLPVKGQRKKAEVTVQATAESPEQKIENQEQPAEEEKKEAAQ